MMEKRIADQPIDCVCVFEQVVGKANFMLAFPTVEEAICWAARTQADWWYQHRGVQVSVLSLLSPPLFPLLPLLSFRYETLEDQGIANRRDEMTGK